LGRGPLRAGRFKMAEKRSQIFQTIRDILKLH